MPVDKVLADKIITFLNELLLQDPTAMSELCRTRVSCNKILADHPTVQVSQDFRVGLLGVLNGLCGAFDDGPLRRCGQIAAIYDDDRNVTRFARFEDVAEKNTQDVVLKDAQ